MNETEYNPQTVQAAAPDAKKVHEEFRLAQSAERRARAAEDPFRLGYHLMPPAGWLNDPNGLCQFNGIYHIFFQYTPGDANGQDHRGWAHYTTTDFIHYQEQADPLLPDSFADGKGAYSGSALIKDGTMHLFYTGNNKLPGDYDYINNGRIHWLMHTESKDGIHFSDKEVLLRNEDYPENLSCHVRDPKILEQNGTYYMVQGARTKEGQGEVEVFASGDLKHWKHASSIRSKKPFGYMWECPDLFDLDGHRILVCCPQGVSRQGILYENIYQNGWFETGTDLDHDQSVDGFTELDNGFDFYAPQSFRDEKGRRILIGWMGIPDMHYSDPTLDYGWQHALTLPRLLSFKDGALCQYPIEEIEALRREKITFSLQPEEVLTLPSRKMEIQLRFPEGSGPWTIHYGAECTLSWKDGIFTLNPGKAGKGRDERHVSVSAIKSLSLFADTSSLEIFINHGARALTTRLFDEQDHPQLCADTALQGEAWQMAEFKIEENSGKFSQE